MSKPIWDKKLVSVLVDIGYTTEVLEDYIIDHQWIQAKKHLKHIKNQLNVLRDDLMNKDVKQNS
jgi:hypothetical protein